MVQGLLECFRVSGRHATNKSWPTTQIGVCERNSNMLANCWRQIESSLLSPANVFPSCRCVVHTHQLQICLHCEGCLKALIYFFFRINLQTLFWIGRRPHFNGYYGYSWQGNMLLQMNWIQWSKFEGERSLVWDIGGFEKLWVREIGIPLQSSLLTA